MMNVGRIFSVLIIVTFATMVVAKRGYSAQFLTTIPVGTVVHMGVEADAPPFEYYHYVDDVKIPVGIANDIFEEIMADYGLKSMISVYPWKRVLHGVETGHLHLSSPGTDLPLKVVPV